jgi:hypothetical protein
VVTLLGLVLTAHPAAADAVTINDASHVLDATRVQTEAATLPDPVMIFTTTRFADDNAAFDTEAQSKVTTPNVIVIAINTQSHHLAIRTGAKSRVSQSGAQAAVQAFIQAFRANPDYTGATIAALTSLRSAIQNAPATGGGHAAPARRSTSGSPFGGIAGLVCLAVVVIAVVAIGVAVARRFGRRRAASYGSDPGYGGPGYGGPGYGGPGYGGGGGVNPWVAGGAGAVAGGVLGYELGRMEGGREERNRDAYDDQRQSGSSGDGGGYGGGGADGDFGSGGGGADFGGGGSSDSF